MIQAQVYRYNPEVDNEPWMETHQVEDSFRQRMVLDVLEHLKERDSSLAYRRSCRNIENCTQVCPKGLNPMKAISDIRRRLLNEGA